MDQQYTVELDSNVNIKYKGRVTWLFEVEIHQWYLDRDLGQDIQKASLMIFW